MSRFYINGSRLFNEKIYGVHRYTLELIKALDGIAPPNIIEVVIPHDNQYINRLNLQNIKMVEIIRPTDNVSSFIWNQFCFVKYVHDHGGLSVDLSLCLSLAGSDIVCIHDCIRELFPEYSRTLRAKIALVVYKMRVIRNVKFCKHLLTVSDCSKADICKLYPEANNKEITVIPNGWQHFIGVDPDLKILCKFNISNNEYFFSLGSAGLHKNYNWVIEAAKQNKQYLFVVSGDGSISSDYFTDGVIPENLIHTGYISDNEIKSLMMNCRAFIHPALYEGFGIPPMEAMSVGARCIVSNSSCLPEIYGDSVWYINPLKYDNISMDLIMTPKISSNSDVLDKYSWDDSARKLYDVLCKHHL